MHQNRWQLELCPDPTDGASSAPPDSLAGLRGPTCRGRGKGGEGVGGRERGREGLWTLTMLETD